ncbi:hypothetical protein [Sphingomonas sp. HMP6]|uniref:hypothetical protein n=1 Tax=Sphingomonas sp. HMP6 TaxID=1517551 RepID=UPI0015971731|nr:hypothetical protein [Sphingomonas sp. HMP6]
MSLDDAVGKCEIWRIGYNAVRLWGGIGDKPPIPLVNRSAAHMTRHNRQELNDAQPGGKNGNMSKKRFFFGCCWVKDGGRHPEPSPPFIAG